jgi:hypothetical protein
MHTDATKTNEEKRVERKKENSCLKEAVPVLVPGGSWRSAFPQSSKGGQKQVDIRCR